MTGKTTALSFLDVYKHIHTQRKQYLQLSALLHAEVTGGLSCSNLTNKELYINFTIQLSQLIVYRHCLTNHRLQSYEAVQYGVVITLCCHSGESVFFH